MRQTTVRKPADVKRQWYLVDAKGLVLGRMASEIAQLLRGKHKSDFTPHVDGGDYVVVINAKYAYLSGKKEHDKIYYHHSRYPGGLKKTAYHKMRDKKPTYAIERAVRLMLPKSKIGAKMLSHLYVYPEVTHQHSAQQPQPYELSHLKPIL